VFFWVVQVQVVLLNMNLTAAIRKNHQE